MTIFEAVKSTVTPRLAAEHFGLNVGRNGMVCCPFHDDRHPSMKLNEDYFYCFGCGAKGDAIEFTSKLFGISTLEAAHMVKKYPDLERGESASETGRTHIPPRLFKEAVHLNRMKDQIMTILNDSNPFNKKAKAEELEALLDKYVPGVEVMRTKLKKYDKTYKELTEENAELEKELNSASRESIQKKLEIQRKLSELDELRRTVDSIPDAVIQEYTEQKYVHHGRMNQEI